MGATGIRTGNDKQMFWYKYFDVEVWVILTEDKGKSLDEEAMAEVMIKEYNDNEHSDTIPKMNKALKNAIISVLSKHGKQLLVEYKKALAED